HALNYEGVFVYIHDRQMTTLRITHRVDADGEHEQLVSLNGAGRSVIRSNSKLTQILPGDNVMTMSEGHSRPPFSGLDDIEPVISELGKHYDFSLAGQERVAGQVGQMLLIKPRDQYRYGYNLWLHSDTGLLLKADLLSEQGEPLERMMFTELKVYDTLPRDEQENPVGSPAARVERKPPAAQSPTGAHWRVTKMPPGFKLGEHTQHLMPHTKRPVEHLVLTDGLASVSVFIEEFDEQEKFEGLSRRSAVNAFGRVVDGHQITVVGEAPAATVELIGLSVVNP
ncbi:MAG: MucB/RseB C-terminal domain-containing protein, partial [Gammaproteobacteria bacterium]